MQHNYEHCVPKRVGHSDEDGKRYALIFRDGSQRMIQQDSGQAVNGISPEPKKETTFGDSVLFTEGCIYKRSYMVKQGFHRYVPCDIELLGFSLLTKVLTCVIVVAFVP